MLSFRQYNLEKMRLLIQDPDKHVSGKLDESLG